MHVKIKSYLIMVGEQFFYKWRIESRIKKAQHDPQMDKYGRRSRRYQSDNRRMPYGKQSAIIGDIVGEESYVGGLLTKIFKVITCDLAT